MTKNIKRKNYCPVGALLAVRYHRLPVYNPVPPHFFSFVKPMVCSANHVLYRAIRTDLRTDGDTGAEGKFQACFTKQHMMPVGIVDTLERIGVDNRYSEGSLLPMVLFHGISQTLENVPSVVHAGQVIADRDSVKFLFSLLSVRDQVRLAAGNFLEHLYFGWKIQYAQVGK
jgi:hypothetical protein